MIRRPPRSTLDRSSAASDVYKRQPYGSCIVHRSPPVATRRPSPVSYTHLRAHETGRNLVCRLLLEKKKKKHKNHIILLEKKKNTKNKQCEYKIEYIKKKK